jgi:hypothetical protein
MNTFKKLYRDFFGLTESVHASDEKLVDEAKLVNGIDEYQGGIVYAIKDPAQAQSVSDDIKA